MTKASRDTQGGRKEREKERKKERGRERERREKRKRQVFLRTIVQGHPEYYIQENPRKQGKKGRRAGGEGGRQEGGVGRDEKKERKERKVFPATTHASKDTPKEERRRFPAMTKASRDTQGGRKEREKERKKERGRERERREKRKRQVFPATNNRPGTHQRRKGEILSITFRKTPESKERKGGGQGEKGAKFSTGSNEP